MYFYSKLKKMLSPVNRGMECVSSHDYQWTFMMCADNHIGATDSIRAPGLTYNFKGPMNVHHGTLLFVS